MIGSWTGRISAAKLPKPTLMESRELMANDQFRKALKDYESGTPVKWKGVHAILDGTAPKA